VSSLRKFFKELSINLEHHKFIQRVTNSTWSIQSGTGFPANTATGSFMFRSTRLNNISHLSPEAWGPRSNKNFYTAKIKIQVTSLRTWIFTAELADRNPIIGVNLKKLLSVLITLYAYLT